MMYDVGKTGLLGRGGVSLKKIVLACIFMLCLLVGCAVAGVPEQAALPAPNITASSSPRADAVFAGPASPQASATPVPLEPTPSLRPAVSPAADALADKLNQIFAGREEFSGSVLIAKGGDVILCRGYGMADAENGVKSTPDTKYLIGSVTKQFTAMAIMQLYERGQMDIRDKLSKYFPDFNRGGDITLMNLLTQTSGITDFLNDDPALLSKIPYKDLSAKSIISMIKAKPLKFEPGVKYSYSNTNYLILGCIVEKVSGKGYGDYLAENIFKPLGMKNTGVFDPENPPKNMAVGHTDCATPVRYHLPDGSLNVDWACSVKGSGGAGCLYSTVGDLYLWNKGLLNDTLLSKKNTDMMFAPSVTVPGPTIKTSYGFGWVIESDPDVGAIYRHTGALSGFMAYNGVFVDKNITVIVLYNNEKFSGRESMIPDFKQALKAP